MTSVIGMVTGMGGKPSKGTSADGRLKGNSGKGTGKGTGKSGAGTKQMPKQMPSAASMMPQCK